MSTRKIKDAKDLSTDELIYFKGHAKATYMSNGKTVEDVINEINSAEGGIAFETDPIFSASPAASITDNKITEWNNKQDTISDLDSIRSGAEKGATALQSVPSEYVTESELVWVKAEGEAGVRLKGTNGTATGNLAISAGDDKTASDGTAFASAASGDHAVAFGYGNTCAGRSTLAQGLYNTVSGKDSVAFGQRNTVNGDQAFAAGQQNEVTTRLGVAIGYKNKATNTDSIAIGYQNTSSGSASVAMGDTCEASGTSSTAMGYKTKATGAYSSTFGENTQATNEGEVAMGLYNKSTTSTDASEQTAFSFGIGTSDTNRTNAFEIKKNGDVYVADKLLSAVATSGSYNDLEDKPTIPVAVTESTVSGWGFTKNTGTVTGVKINGTTKESVDGIVDLGSVITEHQDISHLASKEWVNNKNYATEDDLSNIDYSSIKNVPISEDETGELNIADESGNIGFKINSEGLFAKDVIAGDHVLSNKVDVNNIKTINGQSILGSGNIIVGSGESAIYVLELSELESGTISQEQYDSVLNATLVNIKFAGVYECISTTKVNTEAGVYLSAQIGESSVTIILSSDLTYTSNQSSNSDWNSEEGDPGYIANRTHYLNGVMKLEKSGDIVEVYTSVAGVYMNGYMNPSYRTLKDGESINFGVGCILSRVGNYITLSDPENFIDQPVYVSHAVEQLSEIFIPDNIARKKGFVELIPVSGSEFRINNMEPNTIYVCSESASIINIESFNNEGIVNEYTLHFISSNNPSLNFSNSILWANGVVPELEINTCYELSIISTKFANNYIYKAVLTPFK